MEIINSNGRRIKFSKGFKLFGCVLIFASIYCLSSLVNHYQFRTFALDLGLYTNALFDYRELSWNDSSTFRAEPENLLADHMDLYLIFFAPLSWLFGTYTLLIVQIVAILAGGIGVWRFFDLRQPLQPIKWIALIYFYCFYGIYSALSFDYHSSVVAACLLPWYFVAMEQNKAWRAHFLLLMIICAKENMGLWMFFVCTAVAWLNKEQSSVRNRGILHACAALIAFVVITKFLIPSFSNHGEFRQFQYSILGDSYAEAIKSICTSPLYVLKYLFISHRADIETHHIKFELYVMLILSGFLLLIKRPIYLWMLIPIFFQKVFHNNSAMWGTQAHYSMEFAPVLAIGIFDGLSGLKRSRFRHFLGICIVLLTAYATGRMLQQTLMPWDVAKGRFYSKEHFHRDYNVERARQLLFDLPPNAVISAQSPFVAQLALRETIYQFPIIKDAEYIVLSTHESPYPDNDEQFKQRIIALKADPKWELILDEDLLIFKRVGSLEE
jgi:uncharacterized membrane protein